MGMAAAPVLDVFVPMCLVHVAPQRLARDGVAKVGLFVAAVSATLFAEQVDVPLFSVLLAVDYQRRLCGAPTVARARTRPGVAKDPLAAAQLAPAVDHVDVRLTFVLAAVERARGVGGTKDGLLRAVLVPALSALQEQHARRTVLAAAA